MNKTDKGILFTTNRCMISTQGLIQDNTFEKIVGKTYTWYVSTAENKASNIYVSTENKNGMGGAACYFLLEDGTTDKVVAPWNANPTALLDDTGVDYCDTSLISYIISEEKEGDMYYGVLEYVEEELLLFGQYSERAKYYANKLGKPVYVTQLSEGGSSEGMSYPDDNLGESS